MAPYFVNGLTRVPLITWKSYRFHFVAVRVANESTAISRHQRFAEPRRSVVAPAFRNRRLIEHSPRPRSMHADTRGFLYLPASRSCPGEG